MRATAIVIGMVAWTLSVAWGCGDDDGGGAGSPDVPGSTLLAELSDAQAQELCRFQEGVYKRSLPAEDAYCTASGSEGALSTEECEQFEQECLDAGDYQDDVDEDWGCETETADSFLDSSTDCSATVADYEACIEANGRVYTEYAETASCDDPDSFDGYADPAECASLLRECPDLGF